MTAAPLHGDLDYRWFSLSHHAVPEVPHVVDLMLIERVITLPVCSPDVSTGLGESTLSTRMSQSTSNPKLAVTLGVIVTGRNQKSGLVMEPRSIIDWM